MMGMRMRREFLSNCVVFFFPLLLPRNDKEKKEKRKEKKRKKENYKKSLKVRGTATLA